MPKEKISIIIPVLNEAAALPKTLTSIQKGSNIEIIVVDGGSEDETVAIAQSYGITALSSPPGRATQMNNGAAVATGDILLFLHADTRLPNNFDTSVRQSLQIQNTIAGALNLRLIATCLSYV